MKKAERESIEWTNTWWSEADTDNRRGLLIGDSTTRQLRGSIECLLTNLYAVDLFASSFSVHDGRLQSYMNLMFEGDEYKYDFIVLSFGGHHGFSRLCSQDSEEYAAYQEKYQNLVRYLMGHCGEIVCVTGTSEVLDTDIATIDQERECEIVVRNQIVLETARANSLKVFDLYELMHKNKDICTYFDRQHFNRDSDYFISYHLLDFMASKGIIDSEQINRQHLRARNRFMETAGINRRYMIYGTGIGGTEVYWILRWHGMEGMIKCFVVSDKKTQKKVFSKPVVPIAELKAEERKNYLLIITSERYRDDMYQMASSLQIRNVIFYRDMIDNLVHGIY